MIQAATHQRLVIFGCGYVGSAVAEWALTAGFQVAAVTRNSVTAATLREKGVNAVVADLASDSWHREVEGAPSFALNCVSSGGGGLEAYRHSYLSGMTSILTWARTFGRIGTLVYTSSTSVYPQGDGVRVDETFPTPPATDRAAVLVETERRLHVGQDAAARWFVLRLAGIYGPGRHHLLEQVKSGRVAGLGEHHLNLIHRDDIVAAIAAVLRSSPTFANQVFNVVDDGSARKAEIVSWLAQQLGLPTPTFTGEPAEGRRTVTPDRIIVNTKLKTMLGWRPAYSTFREGYASLLSH